MQTYPNAALYQVSRATAPHTASASMAYVRTTGSYAPLNPQNGTSFATSSDTSRAPFLPGAALYEQRQLEESASGTRNRTGFTDVSRAREGSVRKHSSSPPPSSQNMKIRRIDNLAPQTVSWPSHSAAPVYSAVMPGPPRGTQHNPLEIPDSPERRPRPAPVDNTKLKYYAVAVGHKTGIYKDKEEAKLFTCCYPGAIRKSFTTHAEALIWLKENEQPVDYRHRQNGDFEDRLEWHYVQKGLFSMSGRHPALQGNPYADDPSEIQAKFNKDALERYRRDMDAEVKRLDLERQAKAAIIRDHEEARRPPPTVTQYIAPPKATEVSLDTDPVLKPEQQKVVDMILEGHNVFYTGSAGCGKSTILKAFVKQLSHRGKRVKIVAPTNLAALNVGGVTTWSFAGWTPDSMKKSLDSLMKGAHGKEVWERFDTTDVLVIDEISMVENLLFERLNHIMKASIGEKRGGGPFGGVQVIVTGDFCQLAPVRPFQYCIGCGWELIPDNKWRPKEHRCENRHCREDVFQNIDKWAFRSHAWEQCKFKHVNLTEIHRQSDKKFISILQKIRTDGVILKPHANILLNHTSETEGAIKLFARRDDVDRINNENINKLPSQAITYKCVDYFDWKTHHREDTSMEKNSRPGEDGTLAALKEHRYEVYVHLKEGMRIVLQANLEPSQGLVNGSQGTIIGFEPFDDKRLPRKAENRSEAAAAASGVTFTRGGYAKYFEDQIKIYGKENKRQPWPIVQFDNGLTRTIFADCTASELGNEEPFSLLSRTQIPLMAGYAITVHKSQVRSENNLVKATY
jgi:ATP-dependent DNA helicase PIF1